MLLITDANILIDIEVGHLTPVIFNLPFQIAVPDMLFELELKERHGHLLKNGLIVKSLNPQSIKRVELLIQKYRRASMMDHFALALALQERCPLLTGDRALRTAAKKEGVEVHGTLWIVEELLRAKLIKQAQAKSSFESMKVKGSRLPWEAIEKLLSKDLS